MSAKQSRWSPLSELHQIIVHISRIPAPGLQKPVEQTETDINRNLHAARQLLHAGALPRPRAEPGIMAMHLANEIDIDTLLSLPGINKRAGRLTYGERNERADSK